MERIAIAGAGGYVGRRLVAHLAAAGREVVALGRHAATLPHEAAARIAVDVSDTAALVRALAGVGTAYYLVHSMAGGADFPERDRELARSFSRAAAQAGVRRIVYLGGLGRGELSEHLRSRQEVGRELASAGVEVVELRAAVVIGAGSISFEMLRYLTERLPVMICPHWITTAVQPIAERDLLCYLERAAQVPPGVYEVGSPDPTTYREMIAAYARVRGLRHRRIIDVPVLTPRLSAWWVHLVTPVDRQVSHALIESLTTDVVVEDPEATRAAFGFDPLPVADAIRAALDEQAARVPDGLLGFTEGLRDGVYAMTARAALPAGAAPAARDDLTRAGGDLGWYGLAPAWRARMLLGRIAGERLHLRRPETVEEGATVDWWRVERATAGSLVLGTDRWFCGEAWLGYRVVDGSAARVEQVAALRPRGLGGFLYWRALWPVHLLVLRLMAARRAAGPAGPRCALLRSVLPRRSARWRPSRGIVTR